MIFLVALIVLGTLAAATSLLRHVVGRDGYGHRPPPRSRTDEALSYALPG